MSRKRGKKSKGSQVSPEAAVPEEVLAEGSGPNESVEATAEALADAASEALPPPADVEVKKTRLTTDAWGQPIEVEIEDDEQEVIEASEAIEDAEAETAAEEQVFEEAILKAEAAEEEALEAAAPARRRRTRKSAESAESAEANEPDLAADGIDPNEANEPNEPNDAEVSDEDDDELSASLPTTAATMDDGQLKNLVEALVFASDKPLTLQRLRQLTRVNDMPRLEKALEQLAVDYAPRGLALQQVSGGYQFRTNTQYSVWVQQLIAGRPVRLSRAQLETLAIVAYRQPITRPEVDDIRGVDSSATLRLLLDRSLIRVLGKKEDVGRPTLYGTTREFLDFFSLSDLRELPTLREYSELTAESRKVMSDRLGIDMDATPGPVEDEFVQTPVGYDDEETPTDEASDDAAAAAAVAAVTEVYGVETEDASIGTGESEDVSASSESSDEVAASSDEISASSESSDEVSASSESSEEVAASSESSEDVSASSESSDDLPASSESSDDLSASSESADADASEHLSASRNADDAEEDLSASADAAGPDLDDRLDAADDVAVADDDLRDPSDMAAAGMPRGAAQRDIIGRSTDDEDPVLRAEAEAELDAAAAAHDADADPDEDGADLGSESLAGDESSTDDVETAPDEGE